MARPATCAVPFEVMTSPEIQDTDPDAERVRIRLLQAMSPTRKLELVGSACALSRELILADLRARSPGTSKAELHQRLMERLLGADHPAVREFARRRVPV